MRQIEKIIDAATIEAMRNGCHSSLMRLFSAASQSAYTAIVTIMPVTTIPATPGPIATRLPIAVTGTISPQPIVNPMTIAK